MKEESLKVWEKYLEWMDNTEIFHEYKKDSVFDFMDWLIKYSETK